MFAELSKLQDESSRDLANDARERESAAREGRMGRDWQQVQARIDAGQTRLEDVFSGADTSPAAVNLRQLSEQNLETQREYLPDELMEELAETEKAWERLNALLNPRPDHGSQGGGPVG
jgi:hypothetical protein